MIPAPGPHDGPMKTALHIDKSLLNQAIRLTGINEKAALVRMALEALIRQETARIALTPTSDSPVLATLKTRY